MLSVIVPTHNRRQNLELVLTAIKMQTLSKDKFEVILVDDESNDNTKELVDTFKNEFRLKYAWIYKKDDWNASRPRNYGAKLAEKETQAYVFVDSDVVLNPKALEFYWEDFQKNKNRVIIGPYHWLARQHVTPNAVENKFDALINNQLIKLAVNVRGSTVGDDTRINNFKEKPVDETHDRVFDALACFGGNLLIPRDIFWKAGGYDESVTCGIEDGDFGLTLWRQGVKFSYDLRVIGYHVWHPTPPSRFPPNLRELINTLNLKHFGDVDPDHGILDKTKEAFRIWGFPDWQVPPEWE